MPRLCPDGEDTAVGYRLLHFLGKPRSVKSMIDAFETVDHFLTYAKERDASISTNAHVLQALVQCTSEANSSTSIEKCVRYLYNAWRDSEGLFKDKWVSSTEPKT